MGVSNLNHPPPATQALFCQHGERLLNDDGYEGNVITVGEEEYNLM